MEQLIKSLTSGEILSIDFDLTIDNDCYAQTSILRGTPRCKAFYCFRNDDTREDGEDRIPQESFNLICSSIAELLSNNTKDTEARLKYNLTITSSEKHRFIFKSQNRITHLSEEDCFLSVKTLKTIINLLTEHIAEYSFLTAFRPYI